jgi:hypothetical protein
MARKSAALRSLPVALASIAMCVSAAQAQYDPGASMSLGAGMGSIALGQSTLSGTRNIGKSTRHSDELSPTMRRYCAQWPNEGVCRADRARKARRASPSPSHSSQDLMKARMRAIAPEYNRRVRLQGKAAADRWLAATAREMGRQDGMAARGR